jgi:hypothetical protein
LTFKFTIKEIFNSNNTTCNKLKNCSDFSENIFYDNFLWLFSLHISSLLMGFVWKWCYLRFLCYKQDHVIYENELGWIQHQQGSLRLTKGIYVILRGSYPTINNVYNDKSQYIQDYIRSWSVMASNYIK